MSFLPSVNRASVERSSMTQVMRSRQEGTFFFVWDIAVELEAPMRAHGHGDMYLVFFGRKHGIWRKLQSHDLQVDGSQTAHVCTCLPVTFAGSSSVSDPIFKMSLFSTAKQGRSTCVGEVECSVLEVDSMREQGKSLQMRSPVDQAVTAGINFVASGRFADTTAAFYHNRRNRDTVLLSQTQDKQDIGDSECKDASRYLYRSYALLEVEVRDLPKMDVWGSSDTFVEVNAQPQGETKGDVSTLHRSAVFHRSYKPHFKPFLLPLEQLAPGGDLYSKFLLTAWDWDRLTHNDYIGSAGMRVATLLKCMRKHRNGIKVPLSHDARPARMLKEWADEFTEDGEHKDSRSPSMHARAISQAYPRAGTRRPRRRSRSQDVNARRSRGNVHVRRLTILTDEALLRSLCKQDDRVGDAEELLVLLNEGRYVPGDGFQNTSSGMRLRRTSRVASTGPWSTTSPPLGGSGEGGGARSPSLRAGSKGLSPAGKTRTESGRLQRSPAGGGSARGLSPGGLLSPLVTPPSTNGRSSHHQGDSHDHKAPSAGLPRALSTPKDAVKTPSSPGLALNNPLMPRASTHGLRSEADGGTKQPFDYSSVHSPDPRAGKPAAPVPKPAVPVPASHPDVMVVESDDEESEGFVQMDAKALVSSTQQRFSQRPTGGPRAAQSESPLPASEPSWGTAAAEMASQKTPSTSSQPLSGSSPPTTNTTPATNTRTPSRKQRTLTVPGSSPVVPTGQSLPVEKQSVSEERKSDGDMYAPFTPQHLLCVLFSCSALALPAAKEKQISAAVLRQNQRRKFSGGGKLDRRSVEVYTRLRVFADLDGRWNSVAKSNLTLLPLYQLDDAKNGVVAGWQPVLIPLGKLMRTPWDRSELLIRVVAVIKYGDGRPTERLVLGEVETKPVQLLKASGGRSVSLYKLNERTNEYDKAGMLKCHRTAVRKTPPTNNENPEPSSPSLTLRQKTVQQDSIHELVGALDSIRMTDRRRKKSGGHGKYSMFA